MTSRRLPVFSVVFAAAAAVIYVFAVERNWALFTYHPALGAWGTLATPAQAGPSMYWYGWMTTAAIAAAAIAVIVSRLPENLTRRIPSCLSWAVPLVCMLVFVYLLRGYFLR